MKHNQIKNMIFSALFASLIFVGTQFIKVPLPFGYFNFGDCFVLLSGLIIGYPYAIIATAIGSVLADILSEYAIYVPATLIIKSLMVVIIIAISKLGDSKTKSSKSLFLLLGVICSELTMICGYFIYDIILYSLAAAAASLFGNIMQAVIASVISKLVFTVFEKSGLTKYFSAH